MAGLSKMSGALTAAQFTDAAENFPRLSAKAIEVAREILVDGKSLMFVEKKYGISRQMAHQWANKIYSAFTPQGWVSKVVTLPAAQMDKVLGMEKAARDQLRIRK